MAILEPGPSNLRARTKKLMEKAVQRTFEMEKCATKGRQWRKLAKSVISKWNLRTRKDGARFFQWVTCKMGNWNKSTNGWWAARAWKSPPREGLPRSSARLCALITGALAPRVVLAQAPRLMLFQVICAWHQAPRPTTPSAGSRQAVQGSCLQAAFCGCLGDRICCLARQVACIRWPWPKSWQSVASLLRGPPLRSRCGMSAAGAAGSWLLWRLLWRCRSAPAAGPSSPRCHPWPSYDACAGSVQAGLFLCPFCDAENVFEWPRDGLPMLRCPFKDCFLQVRVLELYSCCICSLAVGMAGWPCLEGVERMWKTSPFCEQSSGQSFYCMHVWDHLTIASALTHSIRHGISHIFSQKKSKRLTSFIKIHTESDFFKKYFSW